MVSVGMVIPPTGPGRDPGLLVLIECAVSDVVQQHGISWHGHSSHGARTRSGSFGFDAGIPSMISISSGTYIITAIIFYLLRWKFFT
nr:MAG TPA: hypothetical protein [Caudoviricetes sp.]